MLPAQELLEGLMQNSSVAEPDRAPQYVLLDIRSEEECSAVGAGQLPRAVCLEPEFLSRPEALEAWLQHFDQTRGCPLCIVDLPPQRVTGLALWKRLLLGERDGVYSQSLIYESASEALLRCGPAPQRDLSSAYRKEEDEAAADDLVRPAVLLARRLQAAGFSNVCVLDGGYAALVTQLLRVRDSLEPLIINHEENKWGHFISSALSKEDAEGGRRGASRSLAANTSSKDVKNIDEERALSPLKVLHVALKYAIRLNHGEMGSVLKAKIAALQAQAHVKE